MSKNFSVQDEKYFFDYIFFTNLNNEKIIFSKPSRDEIAEYMKRIDFLKGIIDMEKLNNPIERVVAVQLLPNFSKLINSNEPNIVTQIHQKTAAKYNRELRSELLNCDSGIEL